ncbi:MAG: hypothetical protein L7S56_02920 [Candidatus Poseidonia sp.]|nr:hypothetical protein [Poseidonia sp.]
MRGTLLAVFLLCIALCALPPASADDDAQSANGLTDGVTSSGYVCDPDGCSPNDKLDYWKILGKKGDIVQISFSGSMSNAAWWCPGDGWEGTFTMGSVSSNVDDGNPSSTLSSTLSTAGEILIKVEGKDSWCNDGFDYTLTPSIDKTNRDSDEDGFVDSEDDCDDIVGTSTNDRNGCIDNDGDGWSDPDSGWGVQNGADAFASETTQWLDSDNDGFGDNLEGYMGDHCQFSRGYSTADRFGCIDTDGDSYSDPDPGGLNGYEPWHAHPQGAADAFVNDGSQWNDTDDDGFGDNWADASMNFTRHLWEIGQFYDNATTPDACPFVTGASTADRYGCPDTDGDYYSDGDENWTIENGSDAFPVEPSQWVDTDRDGWGDNQSEGALLIDDFPQNPTQWRDTDEDGWGDNQTYGATQVDAFPFVPSQYRDSDGDGYGDNLDGFEGDVCTYSSPEEVDSGWISRYDRLGCRDVDKDGFSDPTDQWIAHPSGFADAFPNDASQWHDTDDDGYGDNTEYYDGQTWRPASRPDGCRTTLGDSTFDRWGCPDGDDDGWSDPTPNWLANPGGMGDAWPEDSTQWHDNDGDGRGDNPKGTTADVCPDVAGTSVGPSAGGDRWGCQDTDGDGWSDLGDAFIHEPTQWKDSDGDGYGDRMEGHQGDACPDTRGTSILDRLGCRDTDGDGFSDPTDSWAAHPFGNGDAFPTEALQWQDSDQDGFGDLPLGALRDDCPNTAGTSTRDLQGCPDSNQDGWSNDYGAIAAAVAIMGEDPAASWMTYLVIGLGFIFGSATALIVRTSKERASLMEQLAFEKDTELLRSGMEEVAPPTLIPIDQLPPLPATGGDEHA